MVFQDKCYEGINSTHSALTPRAKGLQFYCSSRTYPVFFLESHLKSQKRYIKIVLVRGSSSFQFQIV